MKTYKCRNCGKGFRLATNPLFCPFCGGNKIEINVKARETASQLIRECEELIRILDPMWDEYVGILAMYEIKMRTLRSYKKRGIVSDEELPRHEKRHLRDALMEYQKNGK